MTAKKIETTVYVANDGTEFNSESECNAFERTKDAVIRGMFNDIPHTTMSCYEVLDDLSCDNTYFVVTPRNNEDVIVINMFINAICQNEGIISLVDVGKKLLFFMNYEEDFWYIGTVDNFIQGISNKLNGTNNE